MPQVFIGEFTSRRHKANRLLRYGWGRMWASKRPQNLRRNEPWAFDNGAYSAWAALDRPNPGRPDVFPMGTFWKRLEWCAANIDRTPTLAVVPDIVCGGSDSLDFSLKVLPLLPTTYPWYLAVQDGMDPGDVERHIKAFSGIFLGGSDEFKQSAKVWSKLAHSHRRKFHYARCGTVRKLKHAISARADSVDSALLVIQLAMGMKVSDFKEYIKTWQESVAA
jgi:hypothetical protein